MADGIADDLHLHIEQRTEHGCVRDHLVLTGLDRLAEPASLLDLRDAVDALIPTVDLPELLAVLVAEACNIGIAAMVAEDDPGRSRDQLFWVEQNYLRTATLRGANAALVDHQFKLEIVGAWGGSGHVTAPPTGTSRSSCPGFGTCFDGDVARDRQEHQ